MWPDGTDDRTFSIEDVLGDMQAAVETLTTLEHIAWLDFYARAAVRIRNSAEVVRLNRTHMNAAEPEVALGLPIIVAPTLYYVGQTDKVLEFLTEDDILAEGALRPGMRAWLGPLVERGRRVCRATDVFAAFLQKPE